jgi:hypothetical protein
LTDKDSKVHVDLGDDARFAMKGEGKITFHIESLGFLYDHDVLYIIGLKKKFF